MSPVVPVIITSQVTLSDLLGKETFFKPAAGFFQTATWAGSGVGTRWVTTMLDPPGGMETP